MKKSVYLAGGFYANDWQETVKDACSELDVKFFDPKEKEANLRKFTSEGDIFKRPEVYTFWDLNAIKSSDIVFVYIDRNNPAVGSLVELGYAKGLGKTVISVIEKGRDEVNKTYDRYFEFARETVDINFDELEEGINFLKTIL